MRGHVTDRYFSGKTVTVRPGDTTNRSFAAWTVTRTGAFEKIEASGSNDGTFLIPCVPDGPYTLEDRSASSVSFVATEKREVHRPSALRGRSNAVFSDERTVLDLEVEGMDPATAMSVVARTNHGTLGSRPEVERPRMSWPIVLDSRQALLDGAQDDWLVVRQTSEYKTAWGAYLVGDRVYRASPLETLDGETTEVHAMLRPSRTYTVRIDLQRSAFQELFERSPPQGFDIWFISNPLSSDEPVFLPSGPSFLWRTQTATAAAPFTAEAEVPLPDPGERILLFVLAHSLEVRSGLSPTIFSAVVDGPTTIVVTPQLGPPKDLRVDGRLANAELSDVGLTPTLAWNEPSLGRAVRYSVTLFRPEDASRTIRFATSETRIRIPPGVLVEGETYLGYVSSIAEGSAALVSAPAIIGGFTP